VCGEAGGRGALPARTNNTHSEEPDVPYVEARGKNIRVKWWGGEYVLDADGKPTNRKKYESASGPQPGIPFQDEQEAYDYGLDREYDVRHGKHLRRADGKTLMKDYCWHWHEALDLRETSEDRYASRLRARIIPHWGERPVGDITAWEFETWKKGLKAAVASGELSRHYVEQLLGLFGMLMTDAVVKYKLRSDSPVVVQRHRGRYEKKKREKKRPMEMEVLHQLATNAHTVWGYTGWACIWTIAFTGMRPPGEVFGLRREYASPLWPASEPDPDLREEALDRYASMPALRVQWQVQHSKRRGGLVLVEPKVREPPHAGCPAVPPRHACGTAGIPRFALGLPRHGRPADGHPVLAPLLAADPGRRAGADAPGRPATPGDPRGGGDGRQAAVPPAARAQGVAGRGRSLRDGPGDPHGSRTGRRAGALRQPDATDGAGRRGVPAGAVGEFHE
jgi:hypothetical protein